MSRVFRWIKRQADQNAVSYSRFGIPGDETDDRPPPTQIHIAPFNETAKEYMMFGMHSQRVALISSGVGISLTLFAFVSVFFEFDWYHHQKGVDVAALAGLVLFLVFGVFIHYQVMAGIKMSSPRFLVPFILVYTMLITVESVTCLFFFGQIVTAHGVVYVDDERQWTHASEEMLLFAILFYLVIIIVQSLMLVSVVKCRNFLVKKQIHDMEMKVAQRSKSQHPSMRIVYGNGRSAEAEEPTGVTVSVANDSLSGNSPPPAYDPVPPNGGVANGQAPPTRTLFHSVDEERT